MQNSLIKELKSLYTGEGFSSVMFFLIWMYCCFNHEYQEMARSLHIAFPLITLCFILAIGAYFWKLMYDVVKKRGKMHMTIKPHLFILFKRVSIILIMICSMIFFYGVMTSERYLLLSALLLCFAIVGYINYFHIRLSYLTPREFGTLLKHKRLRRSHLNRVMHEGAID
ncbi:hypothetical protein KYI11_10505 [Macrococcoides bohemicum]|uniref:Uncharacterized protein n=1 Tax=Macrococcoides bohemicum TaxID=1903056 RepID=A0AAJ4PAQ1_9STAP|nr:hypothetical protein [Macrococcus bohemicus]QYA42016.1 hypothetical protein KYI11_10505 [Macrococcus bohemicus]